MANTDPKIVLSRSENIPFNKLVLSQANVRRVKTGISIGELAEDIARRTLLQSLSVRPVRDADGVETGIYEVPAGGRRFRALELLVKQKRMAKTQPVPCVVREGGIAEEDSLAENVQRAPLHPLDQFRAFQTLRDAGFGEEEIAARFFVAPGVVKQRLKLAAVSPRLLDVYVDDEMTLEQLMAFTVTNDHVRQEQVWEALARSYNKEPYAIRRHLTEGAIRASDKRVQFVGLESYEAAGGVVMRDLFEQDQGGWLQDTALLDRLVTEKLAAEAEAIRAEGWKWIEIGIEFPYGHAARLRRLTGQTVAFTGDEQVRYDALRAEYGKLEADYAEAEELPDAIDQRLGEIETELEAFDNRPVVYDPADIARAGVFLSIDGDGGSRIERGYVRPEDETPVAAEAETDGGTDGDPPASDATDNTVRAAAIATGGEAAPDAEIPEEDDGIKPLADRLVTELTAHRTLALRDALANDPGTAFIAVLHALCLQGFYRHASNTCLEITAKSANFGVQAPGLADTAAARAVDARHATWMRQLPEDPAGLWGVLMAFDGDSRENLFAHCAGLTVNVVKEPWHRRPDAIAHGDRLAQAVSLDMVVAGWRPTVDNYLGRVTKARILEAVREAKGEAATQLIDHLKKPDMANEAERLLDGTGWLPEPLRQTGAEPGAGPTGQVETEAEALPAFLAGENEASSNTDEPLPHAFAAE
ncbi:ParB/RepB/Spo0J family partition protein [Acidiphilium iwatense]|uniref:ParB/RepB/Spo0J family partition protein n=1 Tax=Acidiphilium iwatense TaxID=768198 RepID=A0ABS9DZ46_9PROT|nr:ParB/RepB/Spo0J family partition protein [Acidiphilium iwatense]MCF3947964.1 ParB/RepB/Spo0J family partition protein [Acidiphilium iwatense]